MKLSRIFAMLLMVALIVSGSVIVYSWAQTSPPPAQYQPGTSVTWDPTTGAIQYASYPRATALPIQEAASGAANPYVGATLTLTAAPKRPWSPEQACGAPDTAHAGDFP